MAWIGAKRTSTGALTLEAPPGVKFELDGPDTAALPGCHGMLGWQEFLQNRGDLLRDFDRAKALNVSRPVRADHGDAAEASIRKWLSEFLPSRFGVTSGFIIPNILAVGVKLYHYDVIIYDRLEAPVLWATQSADSSDQGRYRAIPANHVLAVYEVKSSLSRITAKDATKKLSELSELSVHLHQNFRCGAIFFDLPDESVSKIQILEDLLTAYDAPGFWGGAVLRTAVDPNITGEIRLVSAAEGPPSLGHWPGGVLAKPMSQVKLYRTPTGGVSLGPDAELFMTLVAADSWAATKVFSPTFFEADRGIALRWSHSGFSEFAANLLSLVQGQSLSSRDQVRFAQVFDYVRQALP